MEGGGGNGEWDVIKTIRLVTRHDKFLNNLIPLREFKEKCGSPPIKEMAPLPQMKAALLLRWGCWNGRCAK